MQSRLAQVCTTWNLQKIIQTGLMEALPGCSILRFWAPGPKEETESRFCFELKNSKHSIIFCTERQEGQIFCTLRQDKSGSLTHDPEKSHVIFSLWFFAGLESSELFIPHFKEEVPFGNVVKKFLSRQSCKNLLWCYFFSHFDRGENLVEK